MNNEKIGSKLLFYIGRFDFIQKELKQITQTLVELGVKTQNVREIVKKLSNAESSLQNAKVILQRHLEVMNDSMSKNRR